MRIKCIHAGHKASATGMLSNVRELLADTGPDGVDMSRLLQLKPSLRAKLDILK